MTTSTTTPATGEHADPVLLHPAVTGTAVAVQVLTTTLEADFRTSAVPLVDLDLGGIPGDRHWGLTRLADARERHHPDGAVLRNRRQLSAVSVDECDAVARVLGIPEVRPGWLGANLLLDGLEGLSGLPAGTRLQAPSGATLLVEEANPPCTKAGRAVAARHPGVEGLARRFVGAATGLRGIVLSVERAGRLHAGDPLTVLAP